MGLAAKSERTELEVIALIVCWRADNTKIILNFVLRGTPNRGRRSD